MADGVKTFLSSLGMDHHFDMFQTRGYDDEADIPHLSVSDLQTIGVINPMEIIIILKAAHRHEQTSEYVLLRWLREHGLSHYFEGFIQSGIIHLSDVAQLNLPDEDLYDELEITLPGHQRRLEHAVCALRKRQRLGSSDAGEREVVTEGWWGFPTYLPNAKYPFLCVQANIKSTRQPATPKSIDFMVDSGSDVSTLREDIVQDLNLEPITTVRSCGAYGSQRTTMYRAYITLGECKLEIEVIGSSYDSLGSRVLRHFHHHIDNTRHTWFYASNKATTHHNNRGTQLSSGAGENAEPEAETVSVFPDNQRRTISASTSQRNAGESSSARLGENNVSGGGGSDGVGGEGAGVELESARKASQEAEELSAHGDETDSAWLSSQHGVHIQFQPHGSRKRGREQQFSSTSGACHLGDSPLTQIERNHMLSHSLVSSQVDSPPMDKTMVSQGIHPTTSSHQDRTMVSQEIRPTTSSHQDKMIVSQGIHPETSSHQDRTVVSQEIRPTTSSHQDRTMVSQEIHPTTSSHQDKIIVSQGIHPTTSSHQDRTVVSQGIHSTTSSHQDRMMVSQGSHPATSSHQDRTMVSQRIHPTTSSHHGGHLKLSGNGTLSLSLGSESAHKKLKTNPDGS